MSSSQEPAKPSFYFQVPVGGENSHEGTICMWPESSRGEGGGERGIGLASFDMASATPTTAGRPGSSRSKSVLVFATRLKEEAEAWVDAFGATPLLQSSSAFPSHAASQWTGNMANTTSSGDCTTFNTNCNTSASECLPPPPPPPSPSLVVGGSSSRSSSNGCSTFLQSPPQPSLALEVWCSHEELQDLAKQLATALSAPLHSVQLPVFPARNAPIDKLQAWVTVLNTVLHVGNEFMHNNSSTLAAQGGVSAVGCGGPQQHRSLARRLSRLLAGPPKPGSLKFGTCGVVENWLVNQFRQAPSSMAVTVDEHADGSGGGGHVQPLPRTIASLETGTRVATGCTLTSTEKKAGEKTAHHQYTVALADISAAAGERSPVETTAPAQATPLRRALPVPVPPVPVQPVPPAPVAPAATEAGVASMALALAQNGGVTVEEEWRRGWGKWDSTWPLAHGLNFPTVTGQKWWRAMMEELRKEFKRSTKKHSQRVEARANAELRALHELEAKVFQLEAEVERAQQQVTSAQQQVTSAREAAARGAKDQALSTLARALQSDLASPSEVRGAIELAQGFMDGQQLALAVQRLEEFEVAHARKQVEAEDARTRRALQEAEEAEEARAEREKALTRQRKVAVLANLASARATGNPEAFSKASLDAEDFLSSCGEDEDVRGALRILNEDALTRERHEKENAAAARPPQGRNEKPSSHTGSRSSTSTNKQRGEKRTRKEQRSRVTATEPRCSTCTLWRSLTTGKAGPRGRARSSFGCTPFATRRQPGFGPCSPASPAQHRRRPPSGGASSLRWRRRFCSDVTRDAGSQPECQGLHRVLYSMHYRHPNEPVFYLLLCRVTMGAIVRTEAGSGSKQRHQLDSRVPESVFSDAAGTRELAAVPGVIPQTPYHGLVVEKGSRLDREFLTFHGANVYPEYILAYRRTK